MTIPPVPHIGDKEEFAAKLEMTKAFCETAKSYIQISSAALALPLLFTQAIFGKNAAEVGMSSLHRIGVLYAAWVSFLVTIVSGLTYQWFSIRRVWDEFHNKYRTPQNASKPGFRQTWWVINLGSLNLAGVWLAMTGSFYLGAVLFTIFAGSNLWKQN